ncbi:uncharacterized protein BDCG_16207 [Blastomyces dermatitidis ER-3]|uniref:Uncharacterized protein n=3 Tax=Blastomyces TaxID=229219 RepID=A0A179UTB6_BLAGS|nr:uncharacterized protein BDBG_17359 [Blastomyces gilchristii SLH14081]XP_045279293.1 uncharacterized protein BDCG_16207 [Blastomyces dermatitidis ER-3]KMW68106.1 hypothetical protein BDDG_12582 [Blastomyces dermatitidis ATCC 18188]OAS99565.1 hypothetical protein BDCG_16207 [Blastomyces dermatitidis ER-3]OAT10469.1 hypothetical protein BDBG_17359 [Blastomyces gilchristii SLH14081]
MSQVTVTGHAEGHQSTKRRAIVDVPLSNSKSCCCRGRSPFSSRRSMVRLVHPRNRYQKPYFNRG